MQSKLARLLQKTGLLDDIASDISQSARNLGSRLVQSEPDYPMPGDVGPNVPWSESPWHGAASYAPWMFRGRSMNPALNAALVGPAAGVVDYALSRGQFDKMKTRAMEQGWNLGYNNPFISLKK